MTNTSLTEGLRRRVRLHLDTDIGGDIDDACALALLLACPGVELTGITTTAEEDGRRAGYARYVLSLAGRTDIPVAAGADVSSGRFRFHPGYPPEERYWPEPIPRAPGDLNEALALLRRSIDAGATVVAVGPFTNLALLEERHPGVLASARLVIMGTHVKDAPPGYPQWGTEEGDYNVQLDIGAARRVLDASRPTLVPIEVTVQTALRRAYLPRLSDSGPLGALLVRQAEACALDWRNEEVYGATCARLPDDTIAFLHDPLACAVALGWPGTGHEQLPFVLEERGGFLYQRIDPAGKPFTVVTNVDGESFGLFWLGTINDGVNT